MTIDPGRAAPDRRGDIAGTDRVTLTASARPRVSGNRHADAGCRMFERAFGESRGHHRTNHTHGDFNLFINTHP